MSNGRNIRSDNSGVGIFDRRAMRGEVAALLALVVIVNAAHAQTRSLISNTLFIAPSTDYLEQAYDDAKYDDFSKRAGGSM